MPVLCSYVKYALQTAVLPLAVLGTLLLTGAEWELRDPDLHSFGCLGTREGILFLQTLSGCPARETNRRKYENLGT